MLPSLLHMGFDNHYNCVDEHDYNQRMQILLPFETIRMIRCLGVLAMGALILVQHFFGDHSFDGETFLPKESFYNGEAAYLLNQSSATWGQNLSSENSLPNPCASDKYKVYKGCTGYTNDASEAHHNVKNGFCTNAGCDYYEKPHYNETDRVYEISNAGQLYAYADNAQTVYTKGARLTADIVVNEGTLIQEDGTPVAKTDDIRMWDEVFRTSGYPYNNQKLVFDGNNHSISGLYANGSGPQGFALYNYGTIKNLQIKNSVFISTDGNAGGIVAGFPIGPADYKECLLAFLQFVLEFCRPRGSKKERCFCCAARCFLQTAFAISTPVSFLCIFPSFHLVVKERQGAVPMAERYFAFLRILFPEDTSGSPPVWIYLFARNKKRPHYALWHSTTACGCRQKNCLVMTAVCLMF